MIDGEGEGGAGGGEGGAGEGGAGGGEGGGGGGGAATPEWLQGLPDDLKGDATLSRYADVPALAKAHIEAHKVAKSKVVVPGEGADEATMAAFFDAIGRPESPDKYEVPVAELPVDATDEVRAARDTALKPYRELAYRIGLTSGQAKELAQFDLDRNAAYFQQGEDEVNALKEKLGTEYEPKRAAAEQIFKQIFGDDEEANLLAAEMDRKVGSARLVKGMMRLAEVAGEHKIVDSDKIEGFGEVKNAEARLTELQADKSWRDKLNAGDVTVTRQRENLLELAKRQALRGGTRPTI